VWWLKRGFQFGSDLVENSVPEYGYNIVDIIDIFIVLINCSPSTELFL
jgi:hypothetical protein